MTVTNDINKIFCDSPITVNKINMTSLLFIDSLAVSKSRYSVVDNFINLLDQSYDTVCLYQHRNSSYYYEYNISLKEPNTILTGLDRYYKALGHLTEGGVLVFVDGYKLLPSQFKVLSNNSLQILNAFIENEKSTVIIYTSPFLVYVGRIDDQEGWDADKHSFTLDDYTYLRYLFFKNGEIITRDKIFKIRDTVTVNVDIREGIDIISLYRLPIDTENVLFNGDPGYYSYGPEDNEGLRVPEIHDAEVTFNAPVKYAIDDVRYGFFIKEVDSVGCLMITGTNFETNIAYCTTIVDFSGTTYNANQYYVQVPEATSILKYISEYDLNRMLMPEILGSFQRLLLDETYDSIERMRNIRSIDKVDSQHIGKLINFMGLNLNLKNLTLQQKHGLLEELNNFYRIVGTRESYNFYNISSTNSRIVQLEQLFTPIRDINTTSDYAERYVDFRTAEELGAEMHSEYDYPFTDFGHVDILASPTDSFTNQPRFAGILEDPSRLPVLSDTRTVSYMGSDGKIVTEEIPVVKNTYLKAPYAGPNQPKNDYGLVTEDATSFYDLGYVYDIIKGKWIEWTTWDRPKEWYPTNHVDVSVQIPADIDYQTFMTEFKNTFYNIASAVLYIHSIIEVYVFGKENPGHTSDADEATGGAASFDILTAPVYYDLEYTFTNDPARQDYRAN